MFKLRDGDNPSVRFQGLPEYLKTQIRELPTPFFLFDLDVISKKLVILRNVLHPDCVAYAIKCNSHPQILNHLSELDIHFEVNNKAELDSLNGLGVESHRVINSSPLVSYSDIKAMYANGVNTFCVDCLEQLENLTVNAPECNVFFRIFTSNSGSKFNLSAKLGMNPNKVPELYNVACDRGLNPFGITFHVGSQCLNVKNWEEGIKEAASLFNNLKRLDTLNIGGGLPIDYGKSKLEINEIAATVHSTIEKYFLKRPALVVEPGRYLVGDSAMTVSRILQTTKSEEKNRAIADISVFAGLLELIEIDNFEYPVETDAEGPLCHYCIGGPSCAGSDILIHSVYLPELKACFDDSFRNSRIFLRNT